MLYFCLSVFPSLLHLFLNVRTMSGSITGSMARSAHMLMKCVSSVRGCVGVVRLAPGQASHVGGGGCAAATWLPALRCTCAALQGHHGKGARRSTPGRRAWQQPTS